MKYSVKWLALTLALVLVLLCAVGCGKKETTGGATDGAQTGGLGRML